MYNELFLLIIALPIIALLSSPSALASTTMDESHSEETLGLAIKSIREAEEAGADVSVLVGRFNTGVDLLSQAENSEFRTCSNASCLAQANEIFTTIIDDSELIAEEQQAASNLQIILRIGLYAPAGALGASVITIYVYRIWRSYQANKLLDMEVRKK